MLGPTEDSLEDLLPPGFFPGGMRRAAPLSALSPLPSHGLLQRLPSADLPGWSQSPEGLSAQQPACCSAHVPGACSTERKGIPGPLPPLLPSWATSSTRGLLPCLLSHSSPGCTAHHGGLSSLRLRDRRCSAAVSSSGWLCLPCRDKLCGLASATSGARSAKTGTVSQQRCCAWVSESPSGRSLVPFRQA